MRGRKLAGFSIVEFQPAADVNDPSATIAGRLVSHMLGRLTRGLTPLSSARVSRR